MFKKYFSIVAAVGVIAAGAAVLAAGTDSEAGQEALSISNVWEGAYTEEQASRGQTAYEVSCIGCHAATLRGTPGGPAIAGGRFTFAWSDETVGGLLDYVQQNMPIGEVGSLTHQEYADVVAYILQVNEFPAGEVELPADAAASEGVLITRTAE